MVIGGEAIYRATLPFADRIYLTQIAATLVGDARFPPLDPDHWQETERQAEMTSAAGLGYRFVTLDRAVGVDDAGG